MNFLIALLGLFGASLFGSSQSSEASETSASPMESTTPSAESPDDGMGDMPDHGDHDMPDNSGSGGFTDIMAFGVHHGTSDHTTHDSLHGGRTAITTEAMDAYNALRAFLGLSPINDLETIGQWAFDNDLTNNDVPYGEDLKGVGLYYGMQGAKVGWIADDKFDPQLLADIQRTARLGEENDVMAMVEANGLPGFADYLANNDLTETFINTLKMEPHYGGWMHGRTHGDLPFDDGAGADVATAHDLNHLTVLSHDQMQPFMNDTFDWPQWPALDAPEADVADYFQSMVLLSNPHGNGITSDMASAGVTAGEDLMMALALDVSDEVTTLPEDMEDDLADLEML